MSASQILNRPFVFGVLAVVFFAITAYLLLTEKTWASAGRGMVAFLAAALCGFIANLDRIETLRASASGIEAKTREVTRVVDEAKAALAGLHVLAEMTGATLINMMSAAGRLGGASPQQLEDDRTRVLAALKLISLDHRAIEQVSRADSQWVAIDYSIGILNSLKKSATATPEQLAAVGDTFRRWNDEDFRPTPDDFSEMMQKLNVTDPEVLELVKDYRQYVATGTHRRPDRWLARRSWMN